MFFCFKVSHVQALLLPLMTIGHKAGHYCLFRILCSINIDTGRKEKKRKEKEREKEEEFWNLLGGG